jgi:uncharacterized membrane protein YwaF
MEKFLIYIKEFLSTTCEVPKPFGTLHTASLVAMSLAIIFFSITFCRANDKTVKKLCFGFWLMFIIIELGKQFGAATTVLDGKLIFDYSLGALPLHVCSSPFYVLPIFFLAKKEFTKHVSATFLCTFSLIGGLAAMIFPDSVFGTQMYTNAQSMIHHSMQIVVGVALGLRYGRHFNKCGFIGSVAVFLNLAAVALAANLVTHEHFMQNGISQELNMFFISPYVRFVPPAISGLGIEEMPYPLYLFSFLAIFIIAALIVSIIFKSGSRMLTKKT